MALDLLEQILPYVRHHIYPSLISISDWKIKVGDLPNGFAPSLNDQHWTPIQPPQAVWGAFDTTFWFRTQVTVPPRFAGQPLALLLDIPEGLLYVNGKPFQGLDMNHQAVFLTDRARSGQTFSLAIQAYSGRKKEQNAFRRADLALLNTTARSLFTGLSLLRDLEKFYGQNSGESKEIRELIRRTLIYLKYFKPDGEEYPNAIGRAHKFLTQTLEAEFQTDVPGLIHLVGQSHLDVVWLWTLKEGRRKAARTFSTMLRLMEEFPEFRFAQSQPFLSHVIKTDYPDLHKQIKPRVLENRWEPVGAMWVEPDCLLPNGESLIRQIYYGKKFLRDEFGLEIDNAWLPDSFGFNWSLPQILRKSGIRHFLTTKLTWNDSTRFPHNSFWWRGIDGTRVLAHLPPVGLEAEVQPKDIKASWGDFRHQETLSDVLQTFGYGDGGGGPVARDLHMVPFLQNLPGLSRSRLSGVKEFFSKLEEQSKELPEWDGELYLEKHRGISSTNSAIKKSNREGERLLYTAELLSVLASLNGGKKYPAADLEKAWKRHLLNQFHDIVSGTAIEEAYEDSAKDFERLKSITGTIIKSASGVLTKSAKQSTREFPFTVLNTLPWPRNAYVELTVKSKERHFQVVNAAGSAIECQVIGRTKGKTSLLCYVEGIPAHGGTSLTVTPASVRPDPSEPWKASPRLIETPVYRVRMDSHGNFTSIHDKKMRREVLKKGQRGNVLQSFHDAPPEWEAWELEAGYESRKADILAFKSARVVEHGPLRMTIEVIRRSQRGSVVRQLIRFYHKTPLIGFDTNVRWKDSRILLKAAFPVNVSSSRARFEIQFGSLERPTKPKSPQDKAKFEVAAHQWADLSDPKFGVSLLNNCKYGYDAKESMLRLTLLRSPYHPHAVDPKKLTSRNATDQGEQEFTYALYPHSGDWKKGETIRRARELNHPVLVVEKASMRDVPPLISALPSNFFVDSVKKAEDSDEIILRIHEAHGESGKFVLLPGYGILQAAVCDLMENIEERLKPSRGKITLKFSPFEIKTIRLKLRSRKRRP